MDSANLTLQRYPAVIILCILTDERGTSIKIIRDARRMHRRAHDHTSNFQSLPIMQCQVLILPCLDHVVKSSGWLDAAKQLASHTDGEHMSGRHNPSRSSEPVGYPTSLMYF